MHQNQLTDTIKEGRIDVSDTSEINGVVLKFESLNHGSDQLVWC